MSVWILILSGSLKAYKDRRSRGKQVGDVEAVDQCLLMALISATHIFKEDKDGTSEPFFTVVITICLHSEKELWDRASGLQSAEQNQNENGQESREKCTIYISFCFFREFSEDENNNISLFQYVSLLYNSLGSNANSCWLYVQWNVSLGSYLVVCARSAPLASHLQISVNSSW